MRALCSGGTTVLLTTHYLDEAEHLADRVGVLAAGRLVAEGTPEELTGVGHDGRALRPPAGHGGRRPRRCAAGRRGRRPDASSSTTTPTSAVHAVTGWALERGVELTGLAVTRPSLEDVFLQIAEGPAGQVRT